MHSTAAGVVHFGREGAERANNFSPSMIFDNTVLPPTYMYIKKSGFELGAFLAGKIRDRCIEKHHHLWYLGPCYFWLWYCDIILNQSRHFSCMAYLGPWHPAPFWVQMSVRKFWAISLVQSWIKGREKPRKWAPKQLCLTNLGPYQHCNQSFKLAPALEAAGDWWKETPVFMVLAEQIHLIWK